MHPHLHTKDNIGMVGHWLGDKLCSCQYFLVSARHRLTLPTFTRLACEDVMNALEECHARGFLWKSMGMCNDAKHQVTLCLRAERIKRTATNREVAKAKREKLKQAWAEIDENS
jgi:COX assembly mitochondrial protein 2